MMNWFLPVKRVVKRPREEEEEEEDVTATYPSVLKAALRLYQKRWDEEVAVVTQDAAEEVETWDDEGALGCVSRPVRLLAGALVRAEATTVVGTPRRQSRVRFAVAELGALDYEPNETPEKLLEHLTAALAAARSVDDAETRLQVDRLVACLEELETRTATFLAKELAALCDDRPNSMVAARHAEVLSSVLRKELKKQLNSTIGITHGTGSVRFNFDDPAALLHRALEVLHEHGGPSWPRQRPPDALDDAHDAIALASAHAFALNVLDYPAVRAKEDAGDLDRLASLAAMVRQVHDLDRLLVVKKPHTSLVSLAPLADVSDLRDHLKKNALLARAAASMAVDFINNLATSAAEDAPAEPSSRKRKRKSAASVLTLGANAPSIFLFPEVGPYEPFF